MIKSSRTDHFNSADFPILNEKSLSDQDAGRPIETRKFIRPTVGKNSLIDGTLIKNAMGINDTTLPIHYRIPSAVDVLDHKIDA